MMLHKIDEPKKTNTALTVVSSMLVGFLIGLTIAAAMYIAPRAKAMGVAVKAIHSDYKTVETWKFSETKTKGTFTVITRSVQ